MRHTAVFFAGLLCVLIVSTNAATVVRTGLLSYNNMVIQSNGDGNQVTLAPINACDQSQLWTLDSDGFIYQKNNNTLVLDVKDANPNNGAAVIMWNKKSPKSTNQLWTVTANGVATQLVQGFYLRKSSSSQNVVSSNNSPIQNFAFIDPPYTCPDTCTSHGDPHFTAWSKRRFDFQSPNTVLLANFSGHRVYSVQWPCAPGVTCNEGFVVHVANSTDTYQITGRSTAYYNKVLVNISTGTTNYGNYISVTRASSTAFTINIPGAFISYASYTWYYGLYINIGVTLTQTAVLSPSLCVGPAAGQDPHAFGVQFLVSNKNGTAYQYAATPYNYDPNYTPNYGPYTTNDTALAQKAATICSMLVSTPGYGACNAFVAPDYYNATCYNDIILTGLFLFAQMSFDAYGMQCAEAARLNGTNITLPTSSSTTVIVNATLTFPVGTTTTFTIITRDINGVNRSTGGDNFTITSTGPSTLTFTIRDNNDGTYTVTYTATVDGSYTISVKWYNISDIGDSPLNVTVTTSTSAITSGLILTAVVNVQASFTIQARTPSGANRITGGDIFTAVFSSSSFSSVSIVDNNDGTYTVIYVAITTGYLTIDIKYMGNSIACSPFTILVRANASMSANASASTSNTAALAA